MKELMTVFVLGTVLCGFNESAFAQIKECPQKRASVVMINPTQQEIGFIKDYAKGKEVELCKEVGQVRFKVYRLEDQKQHELYGLFINRFGQRATQFWKKAQ